MWHFKNELFVTISYYSLFKKKPNGHIFKKIDEDILTKAFQL